MCRCIYAIKSGGLRLPGCRQDVAYEAGRVFAGPSPSDFDHHSFDYHKVLDSLALGNGDCGQPAGCGPDVPGRECLRVRPLRRCAEDVGGVSNSH